MTKRNGILRAALVGLAMLMTAACQKTVRSIPLSADAIYYARSVADAQQAQMLLNIVKLRYNDPVGFVEITTLTTEDSVTVSGGLGTALSIGSGTVDEVLDITGGVERAYVPSVIYNNVFGERYASLLLEPLPSTSIFLLSESGWSIERLMLCCVARMGRFENARSAAGPAPSVLPRNEEFRQLAAALRELQVDQRLVVQVVRDTASDERRVVMKWQGAGEAAKSADTLLLRAGFTRRTGGDGTSYLLRIREDTSPEADDMVSGRSMLGILSALSQTVHVPAEHSGFVTETAGLRGGAGVCDPAGPWEGVMGDVFAVQSAKERPDTAAVAVYHRGYWFYVDDRCTSAKATLNLVTHLFALQAAASGDSGNRSLILIGN